MDTNKDVCHTTSPCRWQYCNRDAVFCDSILEDIIPAYLEERRMELKLLRELANNGDYETIYGIAQDMQNSGGCYGIPVISEIGNYLRIAAKKRNLEEVLDQAGRLEKYLDCIIVSYE